MGKITLTIIFTLAVGVTVWSFSSGPPDGRTGAPGEQLCSDGCHDTFAPNSGDGSLTLSGLPTRYEESTTYSLTVTIQDPGQQRWGFELAVKDESQQQAGTITVTDATNTQTSTSGGITYLEHTSTGTQNGTPDGPVSWSFDWTSPPVSAGRVWFYVAGNAANGNGSNKGDYIYNIALFRDPPSQGPSTSFLGKLMLILIIPSTATFLLVRRRLILTEA